MKIIDQIYCCQIPGEMFGLWNLQCHLQVFQPHPEVQTVIITNMGFEMGWFVPYVVERLIEQVVAEFNLNPGNLNWIEHYTPTFRKPTCADFSQVTFDWQDAQVINPHWEAISAATAEILAGTELPPVRLLGGMT